MRLKVRLILMKYVFVTDFSPVIFFSGEPMAMTYFIPSQYQFSLQSSPPSSPAHQLVHHLQISETINFTTSFTLSQYSKPMVCSIVKMQERRFFLLFI